MFFERESVGLGSVNRFSIFDFQLQKGTTRIDWGPRIELLARLPRSRTQQV